MIAAWMAYALVIAALVSVAALIGERIAILRRLAEPVDLGGGAALIALPAGAVRVE